MELRLALVAALGQAPGPESVAGLAALLEGPSALPAVSALARVGGSAAAAPLGRLVSQPGGAALPQAIEALALTGGAEVEPLVEPHLLSDRADVREASVRALGRLRDERMARRIEALRSDYAGRVRRAAVEALARLPVRRPQARP